MTSLLAFLGSLPSLVGRFLDFLAEHTRRAERQQIKDEATAAAAMEIDRVGLAAEKETRDAMDQAEAALPDRAAAVDRLRRAGF